MHTTPTISSLSLQSVRCFADAQKCEFGKVTLLVGENGTGKSTLLTCYTEFARRATFIDLHERFPDRDDHDDDWVRFGGFGSARFDEIVRDDADRFELHGDLEEGPHSRIGFAFGARQGYPSERSVEIHFRDSDADRCLSVHRNPGPPETWQFVVDNSSFEIPRPPPPFPEISTWLGCFRKRTWPFRGDPSAYDKRSEVDADYQEEFASLMKRLRSVPFGTRRIAVESVTPDHRPRKQEYSSWDDPLGLEGIHNPEPLICALSRLGQALGLFEDVRILRFPESGMVEMQIKQSGRWCRLTDVGHGVQSILPVLYLMSIEDFTTTFLLQQPEAQLHPSVQAALAQTISESCHRFVIETHSDHLIDRFRICVMEGVLAPEDLKIVHFARDPESAEAIMHNIAVDRAGNLLDVPGGYRDFFLAETKRLLGFE